MTIEELRLEKGLTRAALAERLGIDLSALEDYESGKRNPSADELDAIKDIFGVELSTQAPVGPAEPEASNAVEAETSEAVEEASEAMEAMEEAVEETVIEETADTVTEEAEAAEDIEAPVTGEAAEEAEPSEAVEEAAEKAEPGEAVEEAAEKAEPGEAVEEAAEEAEPGESVEEAEPGESVGEATKEAVEEAIREAVAEAIREAEAGEAVEEAIEEVVAEAIEEAEAEAIEEAEAGEAAAEAAALIAAAEKEARKAAKKARKAAELAARQRADEEAAQRVVDIISILSGSVELKDRDAVAAARDAYDGLTDDQELLIPGDVLRLLFGAEQRIEDAEEAAARKAAATIPIEECRIAVKDVIFTGKKIKKPSVKVVCGETDLEPGEDYSLKYDKKARDIGLYMLTVKGKGRFTGSVKLPFYVVPKASEYVRLLDGDKQAARMWKRLKNIEGYQIEYSRNKDLSDSKKVKIREPKDLAKVLRKLKAGKKTYLRVRLFARTKKKHLYSDWSKVKTVKV